MKRILYIFIGILNILLPNLHACFCSLDDGERFNPALLTIITKVKMQKASDTAQPDITQRYDAILEQDQIALDANNGRVMLTLPEPKVLQEIFTNTISDHYYKRAKGIQEFCRREERTIPAFDFEHVLDEARDGYLKMMLGKRTSKNKKEYDTYADAIFGLSMSVLLQVYDMQEKDQTTSVGSSEARTPDDSLTGGLLSFLSTLWSKQ